jgi:hypothetical protein
MIPKRGKTARGYRLIWTDQPTPNNEQNLRKSSAQEITSEAGVQQGIVLGLILYLIYTRDLPTSDNTTTATFAGDTAILGTHEDPTIASMKLQATINKIDDLAKKRRIKINQSKSTHITFTLRNEIYPTVQMGIVD